eukprot:8029290-Karenia_brevis.AAC.1
MKVIVFYEAIVKLVELYVDGRMMQGDASSLSKGGWTFKIYNEASVRAIACASALADCQSPGLQMDK